MSQVTLTPFSRENTDIILRWRNSEKIRKNMLNSEIISNSQHQKFLGTLEEDSSKLYYLVNLKSQPVAALYLISLGNQEVTWGCYIGADKMIPGLFPALFVLAGQLAFRYPATKILRSEVADNNDNPIKLNKFLNIPLTSKNQHTKHDGSTQTFFEYKLEVTSFEKKREKALSIIPKSLRSSIQNPIIEDTANGYT